MFHFQNLRVFSMIRLPSMMFNSRPLSRSFWVWGLRFVGLAQRFFSSECLSLHASLKPLLSVGVRFLPIILPKTLRPLRCILVHWTAHFLHSLSTRYLKIYTHGRLSMWPDTWNEVMQGHKKDSSLSERGKFVNADFFSPFFSF